MIYQYFHEAISHCASVLFSQTIPTSRNQRAIVRIYGIAIANATAQMFETSPFVAIALGFAMNILRQRTYRSLKSTSATCLRSRRYFIACLFARK
jgi:hypothetical protein